MARCDALLVRFAHYPSDNDALTQSGHTNHWHSFLEVDQYYQPLNTGIRDGPPAIVFISLAFWHSSPIQLTVPLSQLTQLDIDDDKSSESRRCTLLSGARQFTR